MGDVMMTVIEEADVLRRMMTALDTIADELKALGGKRTPADEHAALANGICVILTELRKAGHEPPLFMRSGLNRMIQSAPGIPHRHTDKMFTVRSDEPGERDQTGDVERFKKALKIKLVDALGPKGAGHKPAKAVDRVAAALTKASMPTKPAQLLAWRKEATRKSINTDYREQLDRAEEVVRREYATLCGSHPPRAAYDALAARIVGVIAGL